MSYVILLFLDNIISSETISTVSFNLIDWSSLNDTVITMWDDFIKYYSRPYLYLQAVYQVNIIMVRHSSRSDMKTDCNKWLYYKIVLLLREHANMLSVMKVFWNMTVDQIKLALSNISSHTCYITENMKYLDYTYISCVILLFLTI